MKLHVTRKPCFIKLETLLINTKGLDKTCLSFSLNLEKGTEKVFLNKQDTPLVCATYHSNLFACFTKL